MEFTPLVTNPHLLTILGNFWPREYDFSAFATEDRLVPTEPDVQVRVVTQRPANPRAEIVLIHGLEGSFESGYMVSLAHHALSRGFTVHRFHMRTCGGTEHLCQTLYHAGLTSDLRAFLESHASTLPVFLCGFSLGGNVALKLAGELGSTKLIAGVCAVSASVDLALCAGRLNAAENRLYQQRFVTRMKERLLKTGRYTRAQLASCRTIYEIDDVVTAPGFGFGTADRYYETQSAIRFVSQIRVPALLIAAEDDTLIPYETYQREEVRANPCIEVLNTKHGGHLGFVSRTRPRFWLDATITDWIEKQLLN